MCFVVESGLDPSVVVPTTLWLRWHPQSTAGHHLLDHSAWGSAALEELQFLSALAVGQRVGDGNHELRVHVYFLEWFVALWFVFLWSNRSWNLNRRLGMASLHHFFSVSPKVMPRVRSHPNGSWANAVGDIEPMKEPEKWIIRSSPSWEFAWQ